ncbi:flavin-containing monooxygenase FMO GS-OX-like 4 [Aplysia californica]|uniref:Flavin-containing monooxygenase n=1 Tax=Aplysia californica TaxID=6500 RepID=A0ABM0JX61_APLCA|nr:flavin-containing monooxygenase FMO GS-OX-like 4 [Aplysia californica]
MVHALKRVKKCNLLCQNRRQFFRLDFKPFVFARVSIGIASSPTSRYFSTLPRRSLQVLLPFKWSHRVITIISNELNKGTTRDIRTDTLMEPRLRVAVIGAGAAGLVALRHLNTVSSNDLSQISAVALEQAPHVGGTWFYTKKTGNDDFGLPIHSSMYKNLRTNLPKECMAFPDFQFPEELPSFVGHEDVQKYLEDYATHFDLWKDIKFHTKVDYIRPVSDEKSKFQTRWEVTTCDVHKLGQKQKEVFDAVLVCNGHYAIPMIPDIPGKETFVGQVVHSHNYREPNVYKDRTVVILGANASGQDIALELASVAKEVYLSHNKQPFPNMPENLHQRPGIAKLDPEVIHFSDGSSVRADALMYCTGYHYDYSFVAPEVGLRVDDNRVMPLYKHLIHTGYPNFGIIGVCKRIVPFPMFDVQAQYFRAVLTGVVTLPNEESMNEDTERDYRQRRAQGLPHRHAHDMGPRQFEYNHQLADSACGRRVPVLTELMYNKTHNMRKQDLVGYKKVNFCVSGAGDEIVITCTPR